VPLHLLHLQSAATPASLRVDAIKARITQLRARVTEIAERIERDRREQAEVRGALAETEAELEVEVLVPVANGVDPTEWLPEELLVAILLQVVAAGVCGLVCRRWYAVCQDASTARCWRAGLGAPSAARRPRVESPVCAHCKSSHSIGVTSECADMLAIGPHHDCPVC
jgi:hypothetical protein